MPSTKVTAGALAGAVTTLLAWALEAFTDVEPPAAVVAAVVVLVTFVLSYFVHEIHPAPSSTATA